MLKTRLLGSALLIALALLVGCAKKKPADVSDPKASMGWIADTLDATPNMKTRREILDHANELSAAHATDPAVTAFLDARRAALDAIPQAVLSDAIANKDFESYAWALEQQPEPAASDEELRQIWKRNKEWRDLAERHFDQWLPVFMVEAIKDMNPHFFDQHAAAFKASGYALPSDTPERAFGMYQMRFLGVELKKTASDNDPKRALFLLEHTPSLDPLQTAAKSDRANMKTFADHVLYEWQSEALIGQLAALGYPFEGLDLEKLDFNSPLVQGLMANPPKAVTLFGLDKPGRALTKSEARFLLKLPSGELTNLHDQHVNEAIQMCMEAGGTASAIQFIQLKAAKRPLERDDYIQLMTWAIQYNDPKILELAKKHGGGIRVEELDLNAFAGDQRAFERYAPAFIKNVLPIMDLQGLDGGLTYGKIQQIMANDNEKAGLYLIRKLDISEDDWKNATGETTLLMDAAAAGNLEVTRYLVEKRRVDLHETTSYSSEQVTVFGSSSATEGKLSAIFFAAKSGDAALIEYMADRGANLNAKSNFGATPLMFAAQEGHVDAVKTLIDLGANVNAQMEQEFASSIHQGNMGYSTLKTAATRAAAGGHQEVLNVLKEAGAKR